MSDLRPRTCGKTGCAKPAVCFAMLLLRPKRWYGDAQVPSIIDLPLCEDCGAKLSLKEVLTDQGWASICEGMKAAGKVAPDRARTSVSTIPIDDAPVVFRDRYVPKDPS